MIRTNGIPESLRVVHDFSVASSPTCQKEFHQSPSLQKHIRIHTGAKPYACDFPECGKAFSQVLPLDVNGTELESDQAQAHPHRRSALQLPVLRKEVHLRLQPQAARTNSHPRGTLPPHLSRTTETSTYATSVANISCTWRA